MKKISILIFLSFFIAAPAFAQTHRLKKRQKRKIVNQRSTSKAKVRKKAHKKKHVTHTRVKTVKHKRTRQTTRRRQVVHTRHNRVHKTTHQHRRPVHRVHRRAVHVHHEFCGHHYDYEMDVFDDNFILPALSCPYRTREVSSGNAQWCETRRGVRHGPYKRWNNYGDLLVGGRYHYDTKDGAWTEYHANGYVHREIEYDGGQRCGTWSSWDRHGVSLSVILY